MKKEMNGTMLDEAGTNSMKEDTTVAMSADGNDLMLIHSTSQEASMSADKQTKESITPNMEEENHMETEDPHGEDNMEVQETSENANVIMQSPDNMDIEEFGVTNSTSDTREGGVDQTLDRPQNGHLNTIQGPVAEAPSNLSMSVLSATKNTEELDTEESPISTALQEATQCLDLENENAERNPDNAITNLIENIATDVKESDPETFYKQASQKIVPAPASNIISIPETRIQEIYSCQPNSCSVPGVCSICQTLLTQSPQTIILPPEVSGCIVTSAEVTHSEITQFYIVEEPENVSTNIPNNVGQEDFNEASSCQSAGGRPAATSDPLEGMVEVVVVQHYKCKMCQYKSTSKSTLLRHVKERHVPTACKGERVARKAGNVPDQDFEDEEEDDIMDAGAIDDLENDSDYFPGEDNNKRIRPSGSADEASAKERPRRRPGRPRKFPQVEEPEVNTSPPLDNMPVVDSEAEISFALSDVENRDVSPASSQEEQKPSTRPRGRPPKNSVGKKYRRKGRRCHKLPSRPLLRPFLCRICGSSFLTQEDYSFHVNSHDGSNPHMFRCLQCNYHCRRWSSLKEHMFNHQGNKPHKCDQCSYTSVYKKDVIRHSVVHKQERKPKPLLILKNSTYPCPLCDRVYNMQKRLTQHLKSHSNEKPHMCDKCGKAFKKLYTFKMHLLTHIHCVEESRYKCEFCEYMCEDRKQLLNHQLAHMNDTPFKCDQCPYRTFRQDSLMSHQATKHAAGKPFACEFCHFVTKHMKNLRLHVQCRHRDLFEEWTQKHPEEPPCRRRPSFFHREIEQLKQQQQNDHPEDEDPSVPHEEAAQSQEKGQTQDTIEAVTIIYGEDGEGNEVSPQPAVDNVFCLKAQRDSSEGSLQMPVVKLADTQVPSQEPHMAQVLTLNTDERQVTEIQESGYAESGVPEQGYEGTVQQIAINGAFTAAEYSLLNADSMPSCSTNAAFSTSSQMQLTDNGKDRNILQILSNPPEPQVTAGQAHTKKFSCKICNSTFWGRAEMEVHKKSHIVGSSGFKCQDCNFTAEDWPELRDHMHVHSDLRPHRCNHCSFASRNKKDLSRHAMTHTNHKPHACHVCGQRFSRKGHLKFHIQRLHVEASEEQPEQAEHSSTSVMDGQHIFLTQEETVNQEDTAYIQEITTVDGQTLQQLVTADRQVQYIISQASVPRLFNQEYVVLPDGHHFQLEDGQIAHFQYEPASFLQDNQIHFVPVSPSQQLLMQEQLEAVTAVTDVTVAQTVYTEETEPSSEGEIQYDVVTLTS